MIGNNVKRTVGILVCILIIASSFPIIGTINAVDIRVKNRMTSNNVDELDQSQTVFDSADDLPIPVGRFMLYNFSIMAAQSFKPSKNILTRVELFVGRNESTNHPYVLSIRSDLTGENLVEKRINPPLFTVDGYSWVEFDFDDIWVDIGHTYYIVCQTVNVSGNWYLWAAHNDSVSYPHGCAWVSTDGGNTWSNQSLIQDAISPKTTSGSTNRNTISFTGFTWDTCFKTYGKNNLPPDAPDINGQISGKVGNEYDYTIITTDPEADDLYYLIDWGDGSIDEWIGPYASNELVIAHHSWSEEGTYLIKARAKDVHGAIGNWETLEISMPLTNSVEFAPFGLIFAFGFDVDIKLVQLEPGEDYVDLEVLNQPFYIWENSITTINPGAFLRLYEAKGLFLPSSTFCFGTCTDWGIIG